MKRSFYLALVLITTLVSCNRTKSPDVKGVDVDFELIPFYEELFAIAPDNFQYEAERMKEKYGSYLEAYSMGIIRIGSTEDEDFVGNMSFFLAYEPNKEVLDTVNIVFKDRDALRSKLEKAFKHYRYYFPEALIPDVYLHISGFNQSIVIDSSWVSISLEKYLGRNCDFYERLAIPVYLRRFMSPEKVVPDVMLSIGMTEYPYNSKTDDLINQMIYEGKMRYFVRKMIPDIPDTTLFDFNTTQMEWVRNYEKDMWQMIVEQKHLFDNDRMVLQRYIGKSPFTYYLGQESPGGAAIYLGYRIVESYMKRYPETTLADLMKINDGSQVLKEARYNP